MNMAADGPRIAPPVTKEYLFKILVVGEAATGKTSFIKRYVHQFFSRAYKATIGVDFALKAINFDDKTIVRLQLWDIAGQERFGSMTRVYYKEAVGAFIVFDVSRPKTFESVIKWKADLDKKVSLADGSTIPCVLLANKCDAEKIDIAKDVEALNQFSKQQGFVGWFYSSPKDNINIEQSARFLVEKILRRQQALDYQESNRNDTIIVDNNDYNDYQQTRSKTCCRA